MEQAFALKKKLKAIRSEPFQSGWRHDGLVVSALDF